MKVIGLTGYPREGKDTVFEIIKKNYPELHVCRVAFADSLKLMHISVLGMSSLEEYNNLLHGNGMYNGIDLRVSLDRFSKCLLDIEPGIWVRHVVNKLAIFKDSGFDLVVITDLRYPIEYEWFITNNYPIARVYRSPISKQDKEKPWNKYISSFDKAIPLNNTDTLNNLKLEVKEFINQHVLVD